MKRAKIALTAIALFAVIGGALAFKSQRVSQSWFKTNGAGNCVLAVNTAYTTLRTAAIDGDTFEITDYNIVAHDGECTETVVYDAL